jgi:hypothetical protein
MLMRYNGLTASCAIPVTAFSVLVLVVYLFIYSSILHIEISDGIEPFTGQLQSSQP